MPYIVPPQEPNFDEYGRPIPRVMPGPMIQEAPPVMPASIAMPPQGIAATIPPQPQMLASAIDFSPMQITPAQPTPTESQRLAMQPPNINDPQFHNSRLRTVLNAIAGGLAGAAGGPKVGAEVGQALHDYKYNRALGQYKLGAADLAEKTGLEEKQYERGSKAAELGVRRGVGQATAQAKADTSEINREKVDIARREQLSKEAHRIELEKYTQWKQANPKLDDLQYILSIEDPEEQRDALDILKSIKTAGQKTPEQITSEAEARAKGTARGQLSPEGRQAAAVTSGTRAEASAEGKARGEAKAPLIGDQDVAVAGAITRAKSDPDSASTIVKDLPTPRQKNAFWARLVTDGVTIPRQLGQADKSKLTNAATAMKHADTMERLVNEPGIDKYLGPVAGRLLKAGFKIGDYKPFFPEDTPEQRKELEIATELVAMGTYMGVFEASSASGTRPSWQLIKVMENVTPSSRMSLDTFKAALKAARESIENRIGGLVEGTSGGHPVKAPSKPGAISNLPPINIEFQDKE